ncbi:hypothetical protein GCM10011613_00510 [Cellvibrio zantedeschiae]|uniref:DUF2178 domain-containing protein n=1 Tax=Cellvibrio zantedeschiae TaxID=1237077 RepID=A0ABQ3AQN7_9GAMM|nr:hypothetical protein [Cellvibrio zantedeschiae]GGY61059.1 hypothetical protein GCM10011613_00510 [Cellvibrio zantedeschiae]
MKSFRYYWLAAIILLLIAVSLILVTKFKSPTPLAFCTPAAGILTFFAIFSERIQQGRSADERLRHAIASAVIVQYLVLVGIVVYFVNTANTLPPIVETMLSSFTTLTSVVVAFYFGASAFVEAKTKTASKNDEPTAEG